MPDLPRYSLRSAPSGFTIHKITHDGDGDTTYTLTPKGSFGFACDCPANSRPVILRPCKHRRMLPSMLARLDTGAMYEPESGAWTVPMFDPETGNPIQPVTQNDIIDEYVESCERHPSEAKARSIPVTATAGAVPVAIRRR